MAPAEDENGYEEIDNSQSHLSSISSQYLHSPASPQRHPPGQAQSPPGRARSLRGQAWSPSGQARSPRTHDRRPLPQTSNPTRQARSPPGQTRAIDETGSYVYTSLTGSVVDNGQEEVAGRGGQSEGEAWRGEGGPGPRAKNHGLQEDVWTISGVNGYSTAGLQHGEQHYVNSFVTTLKRTKRKSRRRTCRVALVMLVAILVLTAALGFAVYRLIGKEFFYTMTSDTTTSPNDFTTASTPPTVTSSDATMIATHNPMTSRDTPFCSANSPMTSPFKIRATSVEARATSTTTAGTSPQRPTEAQVDKSNRAFCSGHVHGQLYADPENCTMFYTCDHGREVLRPCGPGTMWDPDFTTCNDPKRLSQARKAACGVRN